MSQSELTKPSCLDSVYEICFNAVMFRFSKLMQQSSSFVMEGVKNLVVKRHNLPVTKIVDELMEVLIKWGSIDPVFSSISYRRKCEIAL